MQVQTFLKHVGFVRTGRLPIGRLIGRLGIGIEASPATSQSLSVLHSLPG